MPIQTFAFPNYAIFLAVGKIRCFCFAQFEIFVVKIGSTCKNKTDLD